MSKNPEKMPGSHPAAATAPPADVMDPHSFAYGQRAPPPSYDDSMRMASAPPQPPQQYAQFPNNMPYQMMGPSFPMQHMQQYPMPPQAQPQLPMYQMPPQQQQPQYMPPQYGYTAGLHLQYAPAPGPSGSKHVLELAKGAEVRTTATGAVTIPPPPPGVAPTPAQLAAMSGQPVMVKQKKRGFF